MENRRGFIKQAVAGLLGVLGIGTVITHPASVKWLFGGSQSGKTIQIDDYIEVSEEDVKLPEDFVRGLKYNHWTHFVYNRVGDKEEMYLNRKKVTSIIFDEACEVVRFRKEQVGDVEEVEFWFRNI